MTGVRAATLAILLVGAVCALAFFSLRTTEPLRPAPKPAEIPTKTSTEAPMREPTVPCQITARQAVWAGTPVTGPVEAVYVEPGQVVTDGQVMARVKSGEIAPASAAADEKAAQAHAAAVSAQFYQLESEAKSRQAGVRQARQTLARIEPIFRKQEQLNRVGATPRLVYEKSRTEYEEAVQQLASAEEDSRKADNLASRVADDQRQTQEALQERRRATVAAASGEARAEIHSPVSGVIIQRKISTGDLVTDQNHAELFQIALDPDLLRAQFEAAVPLQPNQRITIHAGGAQIHAVANQASSADFESRTGSVRIGTPCSATLHVK